MALGQKVVDMLDAAPSVLEWAPVCNKEGKGSQIEICFKDQVAFEVLRMRTLKLSGALDIGPGPWWLSPKRTKEENRKINMVRRCHEAATYWEQKLENPRRLTPIWEGKLVRYNTQTIFYMREGLMRASPASVERYGDRLEEILGYANSDN